MPLIRTTIRKTVNCAVVGLTRTKRRILDQEYENLQHYLRTGEDRGLYSANRQQAERYYRKIKPDKEYPLSIRKDLVDIRETENKDFHWWARIRVKGRRGGVNLPIKPHTRIEGTPCESKLLRKDGKYVLRLVLEKDVLVEVPDSRSRLAVIAVDSGEAVPAASVAFADSAVLGHELHGGGMRGIRAKYNRIRKLIGRKKARHGVHVIDRIGDREHRITRQIDFEVAKGIVEKAKELRRLGYIAVIAVGDVRNHRKERRKGEPRCRKNNRKLHSMSSYRLKKCIENKAAEAGFPVSFVNEAYTSKACSYCGSLNTLRHKRRLKCFDCGVDVHADINGARNILARCLGIPPGSLLTHRGTRGSARTPAWSSAPDSAVQDGPARLSAPTTCDGGTFKHPRWDAPIFR